MGSGTGVTRTRIPIIRPGPRGGTLAQIWPAGCLESPTRASGRPLGREQTDGAGDAPELDRTRSRAPRTARVSCDDSPMGEPELLPQLAGLLGEWTSESTHPALPGVVVPGSAAGAWLEGERFLLLRTQADDPDFPDALWVMGETEEGPVSHYFDSRGVHRIYQLGFDEDGAWRMSRDEPGFNQRFTGTFEDGGNRIVGMWEQAADGGHWERDLGITFLRRGAQRESLGFGAVGGQPVRSRSCISQAWSSVW